MKSKWIKLCSACQKRVRSVIQKKKKKTTKKQQIKVTSESRFLSRFFFQPPRKKLSLTRQKARNIKNSSCALPEFYVLQYCWLKRDTYHLRVVGFSVIPLFQTFLYSTDPVLYRHMRCLSSLDNVSVIDAILCFMLWGQWTSPSSSLRVWIHISKV